MQHSESRDIANPETVEDHVIKNYKVPDWDKFTKKQKQLIWCLYNACLSGRDIIWDQLGKYNLWIRRNLEKVVRATPKEARIGADWKHFMNYVKLMWICNGIRHHSTDRKLKPKFKRSWLAERLGETISAPDGVDLLSVIFDKQTTVNFYEGGISDAEIRSYYSNDPNDEPGINTKLTKVGDGELVETPYKIGGMYTEALEQCVKWLKLAVQHAENKQQKAALLALIRYYETGKQQDRKRYNIAWLKDKNSEIDLIHGFVEVYDDPLAYKGSWEAMLTIRTQDPEAIKRIKVLQDHAQYFEDNSPTDSSHKKTKATGIDARIVNVIIESGDASPVTPIGVCLPNSNSIRENYGSKSINLDNIIEAYVDMKPTKSTYHTQDALDRVTTYGKLAHKVHVDMHEVLGHGSGQMEANAPELTNWKSIIEETRADLFALYHISDPQVQEWGILPNDDAWKANYDMEITSGLIQQLARVPLDQKVLKQTHARNRQLIARWCYEHESKPISIIFAKSSATVQINDYQKLRELYGELLKEVQRVKSQGDEKAAEQLIKKYGTNIDPKLHKIAHKFAPTTAPYTAFIQPTITNDNGQIQISYLDDFETQMLDYSSNYSTLFEFQ